MRRSMSWQLSVLLLAAMATGAQVDNSNRTGQPSGSAPDSATPPSAAEAPTTPPPTKPEITITGQAPAEQTLPQLRPDEFTDCVQRNGLEARDLTDMAICEHQLEMEKHIVIETCLNRKGDTPPPRAIQACNESLDRKILQGNARFYLYANRADAYFAEGAKQQALDDYNEALRLAPRNADLYYNRGVFYVAQNDGDAAMRDFQTALGINPKHVPALRKRAKIYQTRGNFGGALADYSQAILVQPKTAALWSERGYVRILLGEYQAAVLDEAEAIRLDPKLARAYYFRGAAYGGLGDSQNARSDIASAVRLDPSLARYVTNQDKAGSP
jgi:tetratricopeptide (TPR) repeat protein